MDVDMDIDETAGDKTIILRYHHSLGVQTATPDEVFHRIFDQLHPGWLWTVGRHVCKSWKESIDAFILHRLPYTATVLQVCYEAKPRPREVSPFYTNGTSEVGSSIYLSSGFERSTSNVVFKPLPGLLPHRIIAQECSFQEDLNTDVYLDMKFQSITSSIFPSPKYKPGNFGPRNSSLPIRVVFYNRPTSAPH